MKAYGLITDKPDGFSFVVVMSVELYPPIELGLLFTLNGVGGILGVSVSADTEAMRAKLRTGALGNLLFPPDPFAAAPGILDTLAAVFPPTEDGFIVGPMLKLGWGRPISFVTAELALVLSLPDPKVLLLGRLRLAILAPALPLIDLKADIYGEFSDDSVLLLVSLVDSRVGFFAVQGDFGLLLRFGSDPTFVLSAGGFHPRYQPPGELNALRRITAEVSPPTFQLRVEAYAAVTTNSIQFGGKLEIRYGIGGTGVFGYLALDAIIRWAPRFGFEVDIAAGVAVRAFGVSVASSNSACISRALARGRRSAPARSACRGPCPTCPSTSARSPGAKRPNRLRSWFHPNNLYAKHCRRRAARRTAPRRPGATGRRDPGRAVVAAGRHPGRRPTGHRHRAGGVEQGKSRREPGEPRAAGLLADRGRGVERRGVLTRRRSFRAGPVP